MPTKLGHIVRWGRRNSKFTEAFLEGGERVELSDEALAVVRAHDPAETLVFVERRGRVFRYMQWVGTPAEAAQAVHDGTLRPGEIPASMLVIGDYLLRHTAGAELDRSRRVEQAMNTMLGALPSDSPTRIEQLARLVDSILRLSNPQLADVGNRLEAALGDPGWYDAHSSLSKDAVQVGFCARWVQWPNPTDPHENLVFRDHLPLAALAVESATAALVEPRLTESQRLLLYSPLEAQIPRSSLGTAAKTD